MINTIILDIGNVLAHFGWKEYLEKQNYEEELYRRIRLATVHSEGWKLWDRSSITSKEIAEICCKYDPSIEKEIRAFFENVYTYVWEYDYASDFVKNLKEAGYQVYLLSNFNGGHFLHMKENFEFIRHVDGGVISYEVNHIKPEPEIYEHLLQKYQINPTEAVFLDDMEENIKAAEAFGIHTILVENHEQALNDLRKLSVKI